jgi:putative DNA primase/helicase
MPELRPLYHLPELLNLGIDDPVYVAEGEKATDALVGLGLAATTSSGGAQAPSKTDWTPLAGRQVMIWPDNDPPGLDYAYTVSGILTNLDPPATVRIIDPQAMGLTAKQDAADFVKKDGTL